MIRDRSYEEIAEVSIRHFATQDFIDLIKFGVAGWYGIGMDNQRKTVALMVLDLEKNERQNRSAELERQLKTQIIEAFKS